MQDLPGGRQGLRRQAEAADASGCKGWMWVVLVQVVVRATQWETQDIPEVGSA